MQISMLYFNDIIRKGQTIALFAIFGHFLYYYIWKYVFPQPFETLSLRSFCAAIFVVWLLLKAWAPGLDRWFIVYTYFCLMINLPFFFLYMTLQNGGGPIWIASYICVPFYLAWLTSPAVFSVLTLTGSALAILAYLADPHMPLDHAGMLAAFPVVLFAITGGVLFKALENRNIEFNRTKSMALATSIAHELRTPILGARLDLETASRELIGGQDGAGSDIRSLEPIQRIDFHLQKATHIVDNLLLNAKNDSFDTGRFSRHSAAAAIADAVARYPFTARQRGLVTVRNEGDFLYWGDDLLMIHLLMNLIKNALTSLAVVQRGEIVIATIPGATANRIIVRDTGAGIAPHIRKHLFTQFFSAQGGGAGLGLAFCRRVARSFGGAIDCHSRPGEFAEFVVTLPVAATDG